MLRHAWPGNVRELQNRVMRAVILAQGDDADLGRPGPRGRGPRGPHPRGRRRDAAAGGAPRDATAWPGLRTALRDQVALALAASPSLPPLGRWVADDLVLEASTSWREAWPPRAAAMLGVPTTTLRRRLAAAQAQAGAGWSPRPAAWPNVRAALGDVLRTDGATGRNLLKQVLQAAARGGRRAHGDARAGAALMGVTLTTFRRRQQGRAEADED